MAHSIEIPPEDREQVRRWLVDGDEPADKILAALKDARPALERNALVKAITDSIQGDRAVVAKVLRIYFNVLRTVTLEPDRDEAITTIYQAVVDHEPTDAERLSNFTRRVRELISAPALVITSKAVGVMAGNPKTFCRARTISELRPVFTEDGALKPQAAVIVHQLNIKFHAGPELDLDDFFVTLDSEDLTSLKDVIDRALRKDKEIAAMLPNGIPLLPERRP